MPLDGFLVVDKPPGWTSHDVVAKLRRAAGGRRRGDGPAALRVGHAGTLDPMATGVLVVCLGAATRLSEWASADDKRYLAEVRLGVETDSYDADGAVVAERPVAVTPEQVEAALAGLRGAIDQVPPAHSAIKVGGQRLYDLARRGRAVDAPSRRVTIHELTLLGLDGDRARLSVHCSKGTYVRSLAHDLGRRLGCGAHLSQLRRTASGAFSLADAHELEAAVAALEAGRGEPLLLPLERGVAAFERLDVDEAEALRLRRGQAIDRGAAPSATPTGAGGSTLRQGEEGPAASRRGRAHAADGRLVAIVEARDGRWWPTRVMVG
jgi:tRNA pseudouridine55 synthase